MDLGLPADDDPRRTEVRQWLAAHPRPTGRQLAEAGYVVPHWAPPFGRGADPVTQLLLDEELRAAHIRRPVNPIGIGWAGPTLMYAGTDEQKERWLWPLLSGEEFWCQLFSEPGAGSDLAALTTRAERDGDAADADWVVNGQKVWTSYAHIAKWGILLARTDPGAAKHSGISYFVCPMDAPGIEIRPLIDMTGEHAFNEVFFDDVRIPADHLIGAEHGGWGLAKVTLGNERVSLSGEGALWGMGPTADDLVELIRRAGGAPDPVLRDRLVSVWTESQILRVLRLRTVSAVLAGKVPGPEASVRKAIADAHGQHVMNIARDLAGPLGMLAATGPVGGWALEGAEDGESGVSPDAGGAAGGTGTVSGTKSGTESGTGTVPRDASGKPTGDRTWSRGFLYSPALTVGGGTAEVQRNIVAEKVLGLPRDP